MAEVIQSEDGQWVHVSKKDSTVVVFEFRPASTEEGEDDSFEQSERWNLNDPADKGHYDRLTNHSRRRLSLVKVAALTNDLLLDPEQLDSDESDDAPTEPQRSLARDQKDEWCRIFRRLIELELAGEFDDVPAEREADEPSSDVVKSKVIPQTRIRRFYETLRDLNKSSVTNEIAGYLAEENRWETLNVMFGESLKHFSRYKNNNEKFRPQRRSHGVDKSLHDGHPFAKFLQAYLRNRGAGRKVRYETSECEFEFVDYEISPWRTTGKASLEDGKVGSSGGGGVDVLLSSTNTNAPVIAEIKAAKDRDMLLALVQSLVYAVELGTVNQRLRLSNHYKSKFSDDPDVGLEIHLIYEGEPKCLSEAVSLARALMENESAVRRVVGHIRFIQASHNGTDFTFRELHSLKQP